jgi:hypothetical protein
MMRLREVHPAADIDKLRLQRLPRPADRMFAPAMN